MNIDSDFALEAAIDELAALQGLYRRLEGVVDMIHSPALSHVDELPDEDDLGDALLVVAGAIEEREQALSRYRQADVREPRHRDSLRRPQ